MSRRPGKWRHVLVASGVVLTALLLGGCIYLRLLVLKHQLADFDRNFALTTQEGLRFTCLNPVLLSADLRWLGIVPEKTSRQGQNEQWHIHWVKEISSDTTAPEPAAHDLELEVDFTENKFTGFFVAERYFAFIPKPFFVGVLRGLGNARIDRENRSVNAVIASSNPHAGRRPTLAALVALLGQPTERHQEGMVTRLRYRYLPPTPGTNNGDFDLLFTFDTAGELQRLEGRSPVGKIALSFTAPITAALPASTVSVSPAP